MRCPVDTRNKCRRGFDRNFVSIALENKTRGNNQSVPEEEIWWSIRGPKGLDLKEPRLAHM